MIFSKCTLVLLILISLFTTVNSYPAGDDASYHEVFEQLVNLKADPQKSADVSELVISRETGTFTRMISKKNSSRGFMKNGN
jgi:hypothetical protein